MRQRTDFTTATRNDWRLKSGQKTVLHGLKT